MCNDTEEWWKIWRAIDMSFRNWHVEFDEFWPEHSKVSKICTLMGSFWPKYIIFELEKYRGAILHNTEEWCKIWGKTDLRLRNGMRNLTKFYQSTWKSKNWDFDGFLLSKVENVKICRGFLYHSNGKWCKICKRTDLSVQHWH